MFRHLLFLCVSLFLFVAGPSMAWAVCGDGVRQSGENCDDGNLIANDGCNELCQLEYCGDGRLQPSEQCDDGNQLMGDGCDYNCKVELEWSCNTASPTVCTRIGMCGDGIAQAWEQCDNGTTDYTNTACTPTCKLPFCGDGYVQANEECDTRQFIGDGLSGCDASCKVVAGFTCSNAVGLPSVCLQTCGDGIQTPREQCDDGNTTSGDGCDQYCRIEGCGNGIIEPGEACDDKNTVSGDGCAADCAAVEPGWKCGAFCIPDTTCSATTFVRYIDTSNNVSDSVLLGTDAQNPFRIFAYRSIAAFNISPGHFFSLDSRSVATVPLRARIWLAPSSSTYERIGAWTEIASDYTMPHLGDTVSRNYDLRFPVTAAYSHPGGFLLMRVEIIQGGQSVAWGLNTYFSGTWKDKDGLEDGTLAVPGWDTKINNYGTEFMIRFGETPCYDYPKRNCKGEPATCDGGTNLCVPPLASDCSQNDGACCNGTSCTDCDPSDYWFYSTGNCCFEGAACQCRYFYRYNYKCLTSNSSGFACLPSADSFMVVERTGCKGCRDGDICTTDACGSTCTNTAVAATACYTGPAGTAGVGVCVAGLESCSNPGSCVGEVTPKSEICDGLDNDCDGVVDGPSADASCDDGLASTIDTCVAGSCVNAPTCTQTDTDCGTATCENCNLDDGWYNVGAPYDCCDGGGSSCLCQDEEYRDYYCNAGTCFAVTTATNVQRSGCTVCNDGNLCTTDSCGGIGICEYIPNTYSETCYTGPASTQDVGICQAGTRTCSLGVMGACSDITPQTELCDTLDNDCNGEIDDGAASSACPAGSACLIGTCFEGCLTEADCPAGEICYQSGYVCLAETDPCDSVVCPGNKFCYQGGCYPGCNSDLDCETNSLCYQSARCLNAGQKCKNVQCPTGQNCREGSCYEPCTTTADCSDANAECYDEVCMVTPCDGVDCLLSEVCWQASCFPSCLTDADCTQPGDVCWDASRCAPADNPCLDVFCPTGEFCYGGTCFIDCSVSLNCDNPNDACYDATRCTTDACEGVQCPTGLGCHGGTCFQLCTDTADCDDPAATCIEEFCKVDVCDGVQCPVNQVCYNGGCFDTCLDTDDCLDPSHECFNGYCAADPCTGMICPVGEVCHGGTCFPSCDANDDCASMMNSVCWDAERCAVDVCTNVACPTGDICYGGTCFEPCGNDIDCSDVNSRCYDGRCTQDPCDNIQCPVGDICFGGTCYQSCSGGVVCTDPTHTCFDDSRCAADACDGVQCGTGDICFGGSCYQVCNGTIDCSDPSHFCFDNRCQEPCDSVTCGAGETCFGGTCFETCNTGLDCSNPNSICYDNRCVTPQNPACDGVICPAGEACYGGSCYEVCGTDADCSDPNSICYGNVCLATDCGTTQCASGEVCYSGACFQGCGEDADCSDPSHACYDGRCANSACEAVAANLITDYNSDHIFHKLGYRLNASQLSSPHVWPRPYRDGATLFKDWIKLESGVAKSSEQDVHKRSRARVIVYYEAATNRYILWLTHGIKDNGQGYSEATYSVRVNKATPTVELTDDINNEGFTISPEASGNTHIEVFINSVDNTTGGIAIALPASEEWYVDLNGQFSGDIVAWEVMNGENNRPLKTVKLDEKLSLANVPFDTATTIDPATGFECPTFKPGICGNGSLHMCQNWQMTCVQTVNAAAFEVCDGVDNTCNGLVDKLDNDLRFPMIYSRQWDTQSWRVWPTFDSSQTVNQWVRRTDRSSDNRLGNTAARQLDDTTFQRPNRIAFAAHRHLPTGQISTPVFIGARSNDWEDRAFFGNKSVGFRVDGQNGSFIDDSFVNWYDDRKPGDTNDTILKTWDIGANRMEAEFEVVNYSSGGNTYVESDAFSIRPLWNAYFLNPIEYRINYTNYVWRYRWRRIQPGLENTRLNAGAGFQVRVASVPENTAFCVADAPTGSGCRIGTYICTATGIKCSAASDANCVQGCVDNDLDGHDAFDPVVCPTGTDCDDDDASTYPDAPELCDGRDNSCNGEVDIVTTNCPDGLMSCGPDECAFRNVCVCPNGPELPGDPISKCYCGEGLQQ